MISTAHLTVDQLAQLNALLADTTPGGGIYRPPVATDDEVLSELAEAGLARLFGDTLFNHYEITDAGKAVVLDRAMDAASSQAFVSYASDYELHQAIRRLKDDFEHLDEVFREYALLDIEACQNELDRRAAQRAEGRSESTGRHRVVPADDRPTTVIPRVPVQELTAPMPSVGTLPGIPVVEILTDHDGAERLLAAIQDTPSPDDVAEYLAAPHTDAEWAALAADLGDDRSWWRRRQPLPWYVPVLIAAVSTAIGTWSLALLVLR